MSENIKIQLFKSQRGGVKVVLNGFTYVKATQCKDKIYWRCELYKSESYQCHSNLITNKFTDVESLSVISCSGQHSHEGNPIRADIANNIHDLKTKTFAHVK